MATTDGFILRIAVLEAENKALTAANEVNVERLTIIRKGYLKYIAELERKIEHMQRAYTGTKL